MNSAEVRTPDPDSLFIAEVVVTNSGRSIATGWPVADNDFRDQVTFHGVPCDHAGGMRNETGVSIQELLMVDVNFNIAVRAGARSIAWTLPGHSLEVHVPSPAHLPPRNKSLFEDTGDVPPVGGMPN